MNPILRSLAVVVGIPTLAASVYFGAIASDVYVSEARFAVRSAKGVDVGGLGAFLSSPLSSGTQDSLVVADYAHSRDMLDAVRERLDLVGHYADPEVDPFSRLDPEASAEEMLEYFREQVDIAPDSTSDVLVLETRAFDPRTAKRLAELVIELSETVVNAMSERMETDALETARAEVDRAAERLSRASLALQAFQNANVSLDPLAESSARLGLVSGLEQKIIETRSQLSERRAYMREDAPQVVSLANRLRALERQLSLEKGRLVGDARPGGAPLGAGGGLVDAESLRPERPEAPGEARMNGLLAGYQPLVLAREIAQQQHASALNSLEIARVEAQRKKQYLVTFVSPGLPDEAVEPHRVSGVLTVTAFALLIYLIGGLMWSALRDHMGR